MRETAITFTTGCAISANNYYLSSNLDELDTWEAFSKTFIYKYAEKKWINLDLDGWKVTSVAYQDRKEISSLIALEQEGDIGIFQEAKNELQKIRLKHENKIYGQFNRLRLIDKYLYACGDGAQVYKSKLDEWSSVGFGFEESPLDIKQGDLSFLEFNTDFSFKKNLYDINGFNTNNIYVCGINKEDGFIAFYNGNSWIEIDRITPSALYGITLCPDKKNILITGKYGTLLKGNITDGFKNLKSMGINSTFYNAAYYKNNLYIASEDGLYTYLDGGFSIVSELSDLKGVISVEVKEDILWVLSYKKLIRYNGNFWEKIDHPDNDSVSEEKISIKAGERCPRTGYWFTVAKENSRQYFKQGEVLPEFKSDWGEVYWQFDGED